MDVLTAVVAPALFTDQNLYCVAIGRMANLSLEHGHGDASCYAYALLASVLGPRFGDYEAGFGFGKLAVDLVEKHGLGRFKARVYMMVGNHVIPWTKAIRTGRGLVRRAVDAAQEAGDLTYSAFSRTHLVTHLLASGDPLGDVQREAEAGLDFARQARFGLVVDRMMGKLRLIQTLRGLTPVFGSFDGAGFDEGRFERHLEEDPRLALAACWYWIRKLQARFFAGAYAAAAAAAANAERLLWTSPTVFERAEYHLYAALTRAALCDASSAAEQTQHQQAVTAHNRQLQEWAAHCPGNFENRAALVGAEVARLEGRAVDAEPLYEQAIRSARENGFVQNEALAYELASRFYRARGYDQFAGLYLRDARACYLRWGAEGKVKQLEQLHPQIVERAPPAPHSTFAARTEQLDLLSAVKASQTISGEMEIQKLVTTLLQVVLEQGGAGRGCVVLVREDGGRGARDPDPALAADGVLTARAGVGRPLCPVDAAAGDRR
jgi:tetratricopeptide (TPR) repeat protein